MSDTVRLISRMENRVIREMWLTGYYSGRVSNKQKGGE